MHACGMHTRFLELAPAGSCIETSEMHRYSRCMWHHMCCAAFKALFKSCWVDLKCVWLAQRHQENALGSCCIQKKLRACCLCPNAQDICSIA